MLRNGSGDLWFERSLFEESSEETWQWWGKPSDDVHMRQVHRYRLGETLQRERGAKPHAERKPELTQPRNCKKISLLPVSRF